MATSVHRHFKRQKANAKGRGIPWELTFHQWLEIWHASDKHHLHGVFIRTHVLRRIDEEGIYEPTNVRIVSRKSLEKRRRPPKPKGPALFWVDEYESNDWHHVNDAENIE